MQLHPPLRQMRAKRKKEKPVIFVLPAARREGFLDGPLKLRSNAICEGNGGFHFNFWNLMSFLSINYGQFHFTIQKKF